MDNNEKKVDNNQKNVPDSYQNNNKKDWGKPEFRTPNKENK